MYRRTVFDGTSHTVIAMTTLVGGFTLLIIAQVTSRPMSDGTLTLITTLMASVSGWYFGTRSALAGTQAATNVANHMPTTAAAHEETGGSSSTA